MSVLRQRGGRDVSGNFLPPPRRTTGTPPQAGGVEYHTLKMYDTLKKALTLSVTKKPASPRSASIAVSKSGKIYRAGLVETHLLNISSEQTCLALSVLSNDFKVNKIVSLYENLDKKFSLSPIISKTIVDHGARTGEKISYEVWNMKEKIFETEDIASLLPFYRSKMNILEKIKETKVSSNKAVLNKKEDIAKVLKKYAVLGISRNFPTYDSASGYGTAVLTKSGNIYFGGQYSFPEKQLGLHSEMTAIISALMAKDNEIISLGIASTKFPDSPCNSCGFCRQFIADINVKYGLDIEIFTFALNNNSFEKHKMADYLPSVWNPAVK